MHIPSPQKKKGLVKKHDTLVIVPAYNEAESIVLQIEALNKPDKVDILVIDDASTDGGRLAERTNKAHVIQLVHKLGIGGCVQTGLSLQICMTITRYCNLMVMNRTLLKKFQDC